MKKRVLILSVMLVLVAALFAVGCSTKLPGDLSEENVELETAVTKVGQLLNADLNEGFDLAEKYTLNFKIDYSRGGELMTFDVKLFVNKNDAALTKMLVTASIGANIVRSVYYSEKVLYIDKLAEDKAKVLQIDLNDMLEKVIKNIRSDNFSMKLSAALTALSESKPANGYSFVDVNMSTILESFYSLVIGEFGSAPIMADIFGIVPSMSASDLKGMTDQTVTVLEKKIGNMEKLDEVLYGGNISNGENKIPFKVRLYGIDFTPGLQSEIVYEIDPADYVQYSKTTIQASGTMTVGNAGRPIKDLTGTMDKANMIVPNFTGVINYELIFSFDKETDGISRVQAKIELPKAMFEGIVAPGVTPFVDFIYIAEEKKVYLDGSSFGIDKVVLDFSSDDFDDLFIVSGGDATIGISKILEILKDNVAIQGDASIVIEMNEAAISKLLEALNLNDLFSFTKMKVVIGLSNDGISSFSLRIDGEQNGANVDYIEAKSTNIKYMLHATDLNIENKEGYIVYSEIKDIGLTTSGTISFKSGTALKASATMNQLVYDLTNGMVRTDFFNFKTNINYAAVINVNKSNYDDISILINITSDATENHPKGREGLLIGYDNKLKTVSVSIRKDGEKSYKEPAEMANYLNGFPVSELSVGKGPAYRELTAKVSDLFKDEKNPANKKINPIRFLLINDGVDNVMDLLINFTTVAFSGSSGSDVIDVKYTPINQMKTAFSFANGETVVLTPNSIAVSFGKIVAQTAASVGTTFGLFGTVNVVPAANVTFVSEAGSKILSLDLAVTPKFIDVKYDAVGSRAGYLIMSIVGMPCAMRATALGSKEIEKVFFRFNGSDYSDEIRIDVENLSVENNIATELTKILSKAKIGLSDGVEVADVVVKLETDIVDALSKITKESNTMILDYSITNNLGEKIDKKLTIVIEGIAVNFAEITTPNLRKTFTAYGGVDPLSKNSYPKYYDINKIGVTDTFDPATCFILDWDLSKVVAQYKEEKWLAFKDGMNTTVSVTARNILGYEKTFNDISVTISNDIVLDDRISFDSKSFGRGLYYDDNTKILYINPWECPELKETKLQGVQFAKTSIVTASGNKESRDIKISWKAQGGIAGIYREGGSKEIPEAINNIGLEDGYIWYLFGDNIGGYQYRKLKTVVLKREIVEWSVNDPSGEHPKEIVDVNPLSFRNSMKNGLSGGINYATIKTNLVEKIVFPKATAGIYAMIKVADNDFAVYIKDKNMTIKLATGTEQTFLLNQDAYEYQLAGGKINLTANVKELLSVVNSWMDEFRHTSFNFLGDGEDSLEFLGDNLKYGAKTLPCRAKIGSMEMEILVSFEARDVEIALLTPDFGENQKEVTIINDEKSFSLVFDPYAKFDFTLANAYPTRIMANIDGVIEYYDLSWDISALTNAIGGQTDIYTGRSNITIKMFINRGQNEKDGVTKQYNISYPVKVTIKSAVVQKNSANEKVGHAKLETDSLDICNIDQFRGLGIIEFSILKMKDSFVSVNNPLDLKNYATYVAVRFEAKEAPDRWLNVKSWDITTVQNRYNGKFINEVTDTTELKISAMVGNEFSGYQKLIFSFRISDGATTLKFDSFTGIPETKDPETGLSILTVDGDINYSGAMPTMSFNPYLVNATETRVYPEKARLNINGVKSAEYKINKWEIPSNVVSDYAGGEFIAHAVIDDVFRLPVKIVVKQMKIAAMKAPAYSIKFDPTAQTKSVLGGGASSVSWERHGQDQIKYRDNNVDYKFSFIGIDSTLAKTLNLLISISDLPKSSAVYERMNAIYVGNDIGGYQLLPVSLTVNIDRELIDVNKIYAKSSENSVAEKVCERVEKLENDVMKVFYDFLSLPQITDGSKYPEPTSMLISFYNVNTGKAIGENGSNIPLETYNQILVDGTVAINGNMHNNGIYYTWAGNDCERKNKNPYYINVYNRIESLGYDYTFVENDGIVVKQNIEKWFDFVEDVAGSKNIFPFRWMEKYIKSTVSAIVLDMLREGNVILEEHIKGIFEDVHSDVSINNNLKYFLIDKDGKETLVTSINAPGMYKAIFSINEKEGSKYYKYTTVMPNEKKYYGTSEFNFTVNKKDLYSSEALQYMGNGKILSSDEEITPVPYSGSEYKLKVELVSKDINDPAYIDYSQFGLKNDSLFLEFTKDVEIVNKVAKVKAGAVWTRFNATNKMINLGLYAVRTNVERTTGTNVTMHDLYEVNKVLFFEIQPFVINSTTVAITTNDLFNDDGVISYFSKIEAIDQNAKNRIFIYQREYIVCKEDGKTAIDPTKLWTELSLTAGTSATITIVFVGDYKGSKTFTVSRGV